MKTTVWYLLVICLIKVKEMVNYIFADFADLLGGDGDLHLILFNPDMIFVESFDKKKTRVYTNFVKITFWEKTLCEWFVHNILQIDKNRNLCLLKANLGGRAGFAMVLANPLQTGMLVYSAQSLKGFCNVEWQHTFVLVYMLSQFPPWNFFIS